MDAEHRHELNENVLARWLAEKIEVVKPHLPMILLGFFGALAASVIWSSWSSSTAQGEESAWQSYSMAVDTGLPSLPVLEQVMDEHKGESVGPWAAITWADGQLLNAAGALLLSRDQALGNLDQAQEKYEELLETAGIPSSIKERAQLGLARSYELRGEVDEAKAAYLAVEGAFADIAAERAEELDDDRTQEDVVWLATANASPLGMPPGAAASARPDANPDPLALPDDEDEASEDGDGGAMAAEDTFSDLLNSLQAPVVPGAETPAAEETPADNAAGEEKPAGEPEAGADAAMEEAPAETEASAQPDATQSDAPQPEAEAQPETEPAETSTDEPTDEPTEEPGPEPSEEQ
ncbi:MAG: hypothetical protein AAGJ46_03875 [Planctomycetota bacterium]